MRLLLLLQGGLLGLDIELEPLDQEMMPGPVDGRGPIRIHLPGAADGEIDPRRPGTSASVEIHRMDHLDGIARKAHRTGKTNALATLEVVDRGVAGAVAGVVVDLVEAPAET